MKIIKIGAMWCPGCIIMNKVWKQIKEKYNIEIISYDIDMDSEEADKYNVGSTLPVIIFYKNDNEYKRLIGEKKLEDIENVINEMESNNE
ncbi:MAG TPA: thioredoxin family protein [Bacilli bacterium]|nr:thioredoxin family protein [Bacilli bacterium]